VVDADAPRSPDAVRTFFTRWIEGSNAGEWVSIAELMHSEIVLRDPMTPEPARGRTEVLARVAEQYAPFPDGRTEMVGAPFVWLEEPELAYRWRFTGTHLRPVDPPGFAPTGQKVEVCGTSVLQFRDQQIAAVSLFFDTTEVARQVLAAPPAGSRLERVIAGAQRARVRWRRLTRR
jgi:predicted ester cyclase